LAGLNEPKEGGKVKMQSAQRQPKTIMDEAIEANAWGIASSIDIYQCNPETIRSADKIRQFVIELCDLIEMKRFQDTIVVDFGEDERVAGFSMAQLIETSLISGHFANLTNTAYIDVFSCKPYDPDVVAEFAQAFFGGKRAITHVNLRL
jgi:S-adenosylmethionine/arginine decarboxylase-like enzyme